MHKHDFLGFYLQCLLFSRVGDNFHRNVTEIDLNLLHLRTRHSGMAVFYLHTVADYKFYRIEYIVWLSDELWRRCRLCTLAGKVFDRMSCPDRRSRTSRADTSIVVMFVHPSNCEKLQQIKQQINKLAHINPIPSNTLLPQKPMVKLNGCWDGVDNQTWKMCTLFVHTPTR